ncbi:HAD family hydrolase [Halomonas dongshanensis]|uniref:HAD-IA family hydrolase n=1 Tax=Halomonas dongshanensis TaxID=2890835 RepID=A0ABT2EB93_9GAMM|nr:HAD-IA family hydrolase [Halomonas dongshanensis]MCS2608841.1 HAD-IA family hydrolase [Halomonas dongshanensis]
MCDVLIFDCDGVLVDSEAIAERTLAKLLTQWLPDVNVDAALGQALGMTTADILAHFADMSVHDLPLGATARVDEAIEARLGQELKAMAGVAEVLARTPLPMAVVSNSRRQRVVASLAGTGLDSVLQGAPIFSADQVRAPKPDPALYLLAAAELGVAPHCCLVVEDSVAGVSAASAAEMRVIGFTGASHVAPDQAARLLAAGAWQVIAHMEQLPALIARWQAREKTP